MRGLKTSSTFLSHYLQIDDTEGGELRVHYLDEGPADGKVVIMPASRCGLTYTDI